MTVASHQVPHHHSSAAAKDVCESMSFLMSVVFDFRESWRGGVGDVDVKT